MTNVSPPCGVCAFINEMSGDSKEQLVSLLQNGSIQTSVVTVEAQKYGLFKSATTIGRHRKETKVEQLENAIFERPTPATPNSAPVKEEKAPPGWEPYTEHTDSIGKAIVKLPRPNSTKRDLLIGAGFNPDEWQISGPVNTRKWMRYDQEWLHYYKFDVVAGESPEVITQHVDELTERIRNSRLDHSVVKKETDGKDAFVFAISDWQIGKAEGQDGTEQTVQRVLNSIDRAVERVLELRAQGRLMSTLLIASTGDIGEGTCGFYPGQQYLIDRNRRDQGRISRELITEVIDRLSPLFSKTIVAAVGGNHGENRNLDSKRITDDADNDDCAHYEAVKEAFDRAGQTDIEWHIMQDELSMSLTAGGVDIGLTHGHLFQKGATAQQKAYEWWKSQDFNFQAVRGTKILLSSHFHHFSAIVHGSRTHLQTPAMDPGSKWYRDTNGEDSPPGTLTFRLDANSLLGWEDLAILNPR